MPWVADHPCLERDGDRCSVEPGCAGTHAALSHTWPARDIGTRSALQHTMDTRYTYFGLSVTPLWHTKRRVAGGSCVDIRVHDSRSTATHATVNADNLKAVQS